MKTLLTTVCALLLCTALSAQTLERKGAFGAYLQAIENEKGVLVQEVFEGSTAAQAGVEAGDILLQVDGTEFDGLGDLLPRIGTWRKGASVAFLVQRGKKQLKLKGEVVGKPLETSLHGTVTYGAVPFDGGMLRSILEVPRGVEHPPVVFFLPGVGCGSLDYYYNPKSPVKQLVEGLVARGLAVYRVEKPGMGDCLGTQECLEMGYDYEVAAFRTALRHLKTLPEIDSNSVFLYGHSLGVVTAPLLAEQEPVKGIVAWGGVATSWYEYSLKILRDQRELTGMDYVQIENEYRERVSFLYDFLVQKKTPEELKNDPKYAAFAGDYFEGDLYHGIHHYSYFHELNDVNVSQGWKEAACAVMAIYGEHDLHAIDSDWAQWIANLVNFYHPGKGSWKVLPETIHHYCKVPSMAAYNEMRAEGTMDGAYMAKNFNPEIIEVVSQWIWEVMDA